MKRGQETAKQSKSHIKRNYKDLKAKSQRIAIEEMKSGKNWIQELRTRKRTQNLNERAQIVGEGAWKQGYGKRASLSETEIKDLVFEKFYEVAEEQLKKYLNREKREIIKFFETLWDKYKVSLLELTKVRDEEIAKLNEYLKKLGYSG